MNNLDKGCTAMSNWNLSFKYVAIILDRGCETEIRYMFPYAIVAADKNVHYFGHHKTLRTWGLFMWFSENC